MFEQLRDRFAVWLTYRETVRQLTRLDRHILEDVGISPAAIRSRAAAAARAEQRVGR
jgi:uncharacterized protein YjiS (DUF1127 family)